MKYDTQISRSIIKSRGTEGYKIVVEGVVVRLSIRSPLAGDELIVDTYAAENDWASSTATFLLEKETV